MSKSFNFDVIRKAPTFLEPASTEMTCHPVFAKGTLMAPIFAPKSNSTPPICYYFLIFVLSFLVLLSLPSAPLS